jgi:hypothetical protein
MNLLASPSGFPLYRTCQGNIRKSGLAIRVYAAENEPEFQPTIQHAREKYPFPVRVGGCFCERGRVGLYVAESRKRMKDYKPPSWQHYPKQWLGDDKIMLMSWEAKGMHHHLMCIAWQQDPPCTLPDDEEMIQAWLNNPPNWEVLREQIFRSWQKIGSRWLQPGLLRAWERSLLYSKNAKKKKPQTPEN